MVLPVVSQIKLIKYIFIDGIPGLLYTCKVPTLHHFLHHNITRITLLHLWSLTPRQIFFFFWLNQNGATLLPLYSAESSPKETLLSLLGSNLAPLFVTFLPPTRRLCDPYSALCASAFPKLELAVPFVSGFLSIVVAWLLLVRASRSLPLALAFSEAIFFFFFSS